MKIVFLNGPPGSGKDTAANHVGIGTYKLKFAAPIKRMVAAALNETLEWLEQNKDVPDPRLNGGTPRQFLIKLSEDLIKPLYGEQFFGKCLVDELDKLLNQAYKIPTAPAYRLALITDSGFQSEAVPVVNRYGIENCVKIEVHRYGRDFKSDSRSYWSMNGLRTVILENNGSVNQLGDKLFEIISKVYS